MARDPPPEASRSSVDVVVRTFNSEATLSECLESARRYLPIHRLIVIDRNSTDRTRAIAESFGAEIHSEEVGLGMATSLGVSLATAEWLLFLDSDVTLRRADFFSNSVREFRNGRTGAVVGLAVGHRFRYGLPLGLTLFRREWVARVPIPAGIQSRETYYLQRALRRARMHVAYVPDSMEHRSVYRRRYWPEWQGANVRWTAGWNPRELLYSFIVIALIHMNSGKARNMAYTPVFWLKFMRGFLHPSRWGWVDRRSPSAFQA
jgi:glycosyltransferase involved in cell wall biosynthesis